MVSDGELANNMDVIIYVLDKGKDLFLYGFLMGEDGISWPIAIWRVRMEEA